MDDLPPELADSPEVVAGQSLEAFGAWKFALERLEYELGQVASRAFDGAAVSYEEYLDLKGQWRGLKIAMDLPDLMMGGRVEGE